MVKMRSRGGMPVAFADFEVSQFLQDNVRHHWWKKGEKCVDFEK